MANITIASSLLVKITPEIHEALMKSDLDYSDVYNAEQPPSGIGTWNLDWQDIKRDPRLCQVLADSANKDIIIQCSPDETIQLFSLLHIAQTEEQYVLIVNEMIKDKETL